MKVLTEIVCKLESGSRPKGGVTNEGDIPSLGAEHIDNDGGFYFKNIKRVTKEFFDSLKSGKLLINDILIVKDGATTGKVSYISEDFPFAEASINEHVFRIQINDEFAVPKYVFHFLKSDLGNRQIMTDFRGATVGGISRQFTDRVTIPLPTLKEQQRIANILDHADSIRRKNKRILEKYDELAKSVFYEMFGDPITNPKGWKLMPGDQYCDSISVGVVVRPASYYVKKGIPALRSLNIRPNRVELNDLVYFSSETNEKELSKSIIHQSDVLIVRTGQPGTAAIVPKSLDGANCIDLIITRPKKTKVNPVYYSHFFNTDGGKKLVLGTQRGQIQKHFNIGEIRKALIPMPPLNIQDKFASIVEQIETQKRLSQNTLTKSEELFQSLLQRAFKGDL